MAKLTKLLDRILQERQAKNPYVRGETEDNDQDIELSPAPTREELIQKDKEMFLGNTPIQQNVYEKIHAPAYEHVERTKYFRYGRYQKPIGRIFLLTLFGFCGLISLLVLMFNRDWVNMVIYNGRPSSVQVIKQFHLYIIAAVWGMFIYLFLWASRTIHRTFGAFERIMRELDGVLVGKKIRTIRARESDDALVRDLTKRINAILHKLPE